MPTKESEIDQNSDKSAEEILAQLDDAALACMTGRVWAPEDELPLEALAEPFVSDLDTVRRYLENRCGVNINEAVLKRYASGGFLMRPPAMSEVARWSRQYFRSGAYPTGLPVTLDRPPKILYVARDVYDVYMMRNQLNAYGADVFWVPDTLPPEPRYFEDGPNWNGDAIRLASERELDLVYIDIDSSLELLRVLADVAASRGIPCIVQPRPNVPVPKKFVPEAIILPEGPMLADLPERLRRHLPPGVSARLDLSRPLLEDWYGENWLEAVRAGLG